jgi:hypothetical protein
MATEDVSREYAYLKADGTVEMKKVKRLRKKDNSKFYRIREIVILIFIVLSIIFVVYAINSSTESNTIGPKPKVDKINKK